MKCENCKYKIKTGPYNICKITHIVLNHELGKQTDECSLESDEDVPSMKICFNCANWIGGGDWGLSCKDNYYNTSTNGFDAACERFKENIHKV